MDTSPVKIFRFTRNINNGHFHIHFFISNTFNVTENVITTSESN